jgi:hypothetical protein
MGLKSIPQPAGDGYYLGGIPHGYVVQMYIIIIPSGHALIVGCVFAVCGGLVDMSQEAPTITLVSASPLIRHSPRCPSGAMGGNLMAVILMIVSRIYSISLFGHNHPPLVGGLQSGNHTS